MSSKYECLSLYVFYVWMYLCLLGMNVCPRMFSMHVWFHCMHIFNLWMFHCVYIFNACVFSLYLYFQCICIFNVVCFFLVCVYSMYVYFQCMYECFHFNICIVYVCMFMSMYVVHLLLASPVTRPTIFSAVRSIISFYHTTINFSQNGLSCLGHH